MDTFSNANNFRNKDLRELNPREKWCIQTWWSLLEFHSLKYLFLEITVLADLGMGLRVGGGWKLTEFSNFLGVIFQSGGQIRRIMHFEWRKNVFLKTWGGGSRGTWGANPPPPCRGLYLPFKKFTSRRGDILVTSESIVGVYIRQEMPPTYRHLGRF